MTRDVKAEIQPDTFWWHVGDAGVPRVVRVVDVYRRTGCVTFRTFDGTTGWSQLWDADARWVEAVRPAILGYFGSFVGVKADTYWWRGSEVVRVIDVTSDPPGVAYFSTHTGMGYDGVADKHRWRARVSGPWTWTRWGGE